MISWLSRTSLQFPPVSNALKDPNGLLAAGGDLSCERLLNAYRNGIFPWYNPAEPILWWSPDPRCVIYTDRLHISRSLRKRLRRDDYQVTFDRAFSAVMHGCAAPRTGSDGTWISPDMHAAYCKLHQDGHAHSVELWQDGELVGGLYGIAIGRMFFGESMFSRRTDASKITFAWLVEQLRIWGYPLIDCQVYNPHLVTLGAQEVTRETFLQELNRNADIPGNNNWTFDIDASAF